MTTSFMTSAVFNQNPSKAKKEADRGPLVITEHGEARYVMMRYEEFASHWKPPISAYDALYDPNGSDQDFDPPRLDFIKRDIEF